MMARIKAARFGRAVALAGALACAAGAVAQTVGDNDLPQAGLDLPENLQIFGKFDPNIRKPTAIVNSAVITGTDVDQRLALLAAANGINLTPETRDRLRLQVVRQLIDETLQIQEAKTHDVTITADEIAQSYARVARNFGKGPTEMNAWLRTIGSSEASLRRQIEGELAWRRLLQRRVNPFINVGDEEVQAILDRMKAAKGTDEYHLKEIYLQAPPERAAQSFATAQSIIDMMQGKGDSPEKGQPFDYYALKYSQASTKAMGGDLDWVRAAQLPDELSRATQSMQVGQIVGPVQVPGGYSILYLVDKRQVLTADPRDAKLSLRQVAIKFPAGATKETASAKAAEFANAMAKVNGCGAVTKAAADIGAEVVDNDAVKIRDLPAQLQDMMSKLQVGQATPPFGSVEEGVRSLVLCGRDETAAANLPSNDQIRNQLEDERVNLRAQRMLRDLRRDAIVEYR